MKTDTSKSSNKALESLIGIALALPGITPVKAQQPISTNPKADAFYSSYSEDKNHYKIDTYESSFLFPVSKDLEIELRALRDLMTGASPNGYYPNLVVSGASSGVIIPETSVDPAFLLTEVSSGPSIIDTRNQAEASLHYYLPESKLTSNTGYSTENDYESFFENLRSEWYFNKKNTVLYTGIGYAYNITNVTVSDNIYGKSNTESLFLGIKQDINKNFYIQQNAEVIFDNGYLADPYKNILFNGPEDNIPKGIDAQDRGHNVFAAPDQRPKRRITGAFVTNLVHYIPCFDSAIHFNYRYASNSWNIHSNTFVLAYYQPFLKSWEIAPKVRYYTQDRASFYALSFHTIPTPLFLHSKPLRKGKASSDYRLANYGSIGYDITLTKLFKNPGIKVSATYGFAKRATGIGWKKNKGPKNPSNQFNSQYVAVQLSADFPEKTSFKKTEKCDYAYRKGDISLQPLTVSFAGMTFGRKHYDTKFVTSDFSNSKNMYPNARGFGLNDIHRNGIGYDFQAGYFLLDYIEAFADFGVVHEKKLKQPTVFNTLAFQFKERTTYRTNLGAKYYFDTKTVFSPFVGIMGGVEWQPKTKANIYSVLGDPEFSTSPGPLIGKFEIFKAQNLFNGALMAGLDYRFDKNFAISLATGLYYYKRNKAKTLFVPNAPPYRVSDHKNKIITPISISMKIII
ncbi:MAG: DUF3570 domain-containing protein [Alphaproteobacteria bacterium]|nr:DUF3570 domain-containing protein [Alphaproteobacteria bacterium]